MEAYERHFLSPVLTSSRARTWLFVSMTCSRALSTTAWPPSASAARRPTPWSHPPAIGSCSTADERAPPASRFGRDEWSALFDQQTGAFTREAIGRLAALGEMRVEAHYGPGTSLSHWDEELFDRELMTGIKDPKEHVLPVTIDVMRLLGHQVCETLAAKTELDTPLSMLSTVAFSRKDEARAIDRDHCEMTEIWELVPHTEQLPAA